MVIVDMIQVFLKNMDLNITVLIPYFLKQVPWVDISKNVLDKDP